MGWALLNPNVLAESRPVMLDRLRDYVIIVRLSLYAFDLLLHANTLCAHFLS